MTLLSLAQVHRSIGHIWLTCLLENAKRSTTLSQKSFFEFCKDVGDLSTFLY
jgi:hypothetical protein